MAMRAMGRLRIAFADREITMDDFNRSVSLQHYGAQGSICGIRSVRPVWTPRYMRKQPPHNALHPTARAQARLVESRLEEARAAGERER